MKIFLSAVSAQFKTCRDALASDLRAVGAQVIVQEDFQQHGYSLLEKLDEYVASCDRVIALVGDAYGWEPGDAARPIDRPPRSYTQWEYYFAQGDRLDGTKQPARPTYIYFAAPEYLAQYPVTEDSAAVDRQRAFVAEIRGTGKDYNVFTSVDELRARVLRDGFHLAERQPEPRNLPFASLGALFRGREPLLDRLRSGFNGVSATAIFGSGGIGKTRVAVEYAWRHADKHTAQLFVAADSPGSLLRNFAALTSPSILNLPEWARDDDDVRRDAALRWLAANPGWLLILDNVDTEAAAAAAEDLLASLAGGHVLITSRIMQWSAVVEPIELDTLSDESAADFLLARTKGRRRTLSTDDSDVAILAHELGGLPLALEQAGAYIAYRRCAFADYLAAWRSNINAVAGWFNARTMNYARSLAQTWQVTVEQLRPGDVALLRLFLWIAPEPFPRTLLQDGAANAVWQRATALFKQESNSAAGGDSNGNLTLEDALSDLLNFSLLKLTADASSVVLHPVIQQVLRQQVPEGSRKEWLNLSFMLVLTLVSLEELKRDSRSAVSGPLRVHQVALLINADDAGYLDEAPDAADTMDDIGGSLAGRGYNAEAEKLFRRALHKSEQAFGSEHVVVADRLRRLALLLSVADQAIEAEALLSRALAIHERELGDGDPIVADERDHLEFLRKPKGESGQTAVLQTLEKIGRRAKVRGIFLGEIGKTPHR